MKKLIALLLALLICAPALAEFTPPPAAEFAGGNIPYETAYAKFESTLRTYSDFGWGEAAVDMREVAQTVLEELVEESVLRIKAQELGLMDISDAEMAELRARAEESFTAQVDYYLDFYTSPDMPIDEARALTADMLIADGITVDSLLEEMIEDRWYSALYAHVCDGVVIDENHIWAYADSMAATQMLDYADDPVNFDYLYMNDDIIAWYPEGMRYIKHILIGFDEDQAQAYQDLVGEGTQDDVDPAALDAIYAPLEGTVAEVSGLLADGADFDELMRTYGHDDFMLYEPYSVNGYIVRPGSELFVPEFVEACFALTNVGDISAPVRTSGGIHFLMYVGDVPAGNVPLENIIDYVASEAQDQLLSDTFDAQVAAWIAEAQPVYYPEYLLE